MKEVFKDACENPELYVVSSLGRIFKKPYKAFYGDLKEEKNFGYREIHQKKDKNGYMFVSIIGKDGKIKSHWVHRIVAKAFIENPYNKPQVNHKDLDKKNNCIDNLEWVTPKENIKHARQNGRGPKGSQIWNSILTEELVKKIWELRSKGMEPAKIADAINPIKRATINNIISGRTWKHLNPNKK